MKIPVLILALALAAAAQIEPLPKRTVTCATTAEIRAALKDARPGDRIAVKPGTYLSEVPDAFKLPEMEVAAWFSAGADGTAADPIVFESEDASRPAVLKGADLSRGYAFYLTGGHWKVRNLVFTNASKGVMLDHADDVHLFRLEVHHVAAEGIHLRDGSSRCVIESTHVHDTGLETPVWGEGIYIGSDRNKWDWLKKDCNQNRVTGCVLGPNVAGEHVDIKEGTVGTVVERCTFRGSGLIGGGPPDGFVDAKGNDAVIRHNIAYREGNPAIRNAFQVHQQVDGWGLNNSFTHNTLHMDDTAAWVLDAPVGGAVVGFNSRFPEGNLYTGKYVRNDLPVVAGHPTWDPWGINRKGDKVYWEGRIWEARSYTLRVEPAPTADGLARWRDLGPAGTALFPGLRRGTSEASGRGFRSHARRLDGKRLPVPKGSPP